MMGGNNDNSMPTGYGQGGYGQSSGYGHRQDSGWNPHATSGASSPAYGTEFAHTHTHDADPFVAASSQVAIDIETISLNYREIRDATHEINTPKDTVEFRHSLYVRFELLAVPNNRITTILLNSCFGHCLPSPVGTNSSACLLVMINLADERRLMTQVPWERRFKAQSGLWPPFRPAAFRSAAYVALSISTSFFTSDTMFILPECDK
jgi:hypothetical protein